MVDGIDNAASQAYGAWPDRLYIVGTDGTVAFAGAPGPKGFDPDQVRTALTELVAGSSAPAAPSEGTPQGETR